MVLLALIVSIGAQAQIKLVSYEDQKISGYKSIVFETETSGGTKVTKVFDIEANNPFGTAPTNSNLGRPLKNYKKLENEDLREMAQKKISSIRNTHSATSFDQSVVVQYNENVFVEGQGDVAAQESVLLILDENGEEIFRKSSDQGFWSVVVSKDNRLVAYKYGGFCIESSDCAYTSYGLRIFDTKNNRFLEDISLGDFKNIEDPAVYEDFLFTICRVDINDYLLNIYNVRSGLRYSTRLNEFQVTHILDYTNDGVVLLRNGQKELLGFSEYFTKSKF